MVGKIAIEVYVEAEDPAFLAENFKRRFEQRIVGTLPGGRVTGAKVGELEEVK